LLGLVRCPSNGPESSSFDLGIKMACKIQAEAYGEPEAANVPMRWTVDEKLGWEGEA
jgi:hypothetical protein